MPPIADLSRVQRAYSISDARPDDGARICCARTASWPAAAAARWWRRRCAIAANRRSRRRVVTFVCDTGNKYLSKMFNDHWLNDQGLGDRPASATCAT